jgi:hypothetical protein
MPTRTLRFCTSLCAAVSIAVGAQIAAQEPSPRAPRTGMLVGQVRDAASGAPVGEAIVQLTLQGVAENEPDSPNGRVVSDSEGRFFFTQLPRGRYYLSASKDGYASGGHRQLQPAASGQSITLAEGERRTDADLRVWKYAVIGGTVVDEAGEPVVGIGVRALLKDVFAGRTRYGSMQLVLEPTAVTDDRGMFRLSQLVPGTYVVVVPSTHTTLPTATLARADATLRNQLFWGGVSEMTPLGHPRSMQLGEFTVMTLNRVVIPPPPAPDGRMQVYRTTFYPASSTAAAATAVTVNSGEDRSDLSISLRPMAASRVSGRLVTPDGSIPPPTMIRLDGAALNDFVGFGRASGPDYVGLETATALSDGQGRFSFIGVPPGEYTIREGNRYLARPIAEGKPSYWISQALVVGREDIANLNVELRPALQVSGRIEMRKENESSPPPQIIGVQIETPYGAPGQVFAEVARDALTFSTYAAGGQYIVRPYETGGWVVHSVTIDGKDVTDRVVDLQADITSVVVTYTDRRTAVTGSVTTSEGTPAETSVVLAFPVDRQRWFGYGTSPRVLKTVLPSKSGVYTIEHLPPGDYYLIAIEASELDGWRDPARLEALSSSASRLSIATGDTQKTVDLRVKAGR